MTIIGLFAILYSISENGDIGSLQLTDYSIINSKSSRQLHEEVIEEPPPLTAEEQAAEDLRREKEKDEYLKWQKANYRYDDDPLTNRGPLHYAPYTGGNKFPEYETLTDKPGFKIWVDGGVLDYTLEICYAKKLNCSETCCL